MLVDETEELALRVRDVHAFPQQILHLVLERIVRQPVAIPLVEKVLDCWPTP